MSRIFSCFFSVGRRVVAGLFLACVMTLCCVPSAFAACDGSYGSVMAACQSYASSLNNVGCAKLTDAKPNIPGNIVAYIKPSTANVIKSWGYCLVDNPKNPCAGLQPTSPWFMVGEVLDGQAISLPQTDENGATVQCSYTAKNTGVPTFMYGKWRSKVTFTPSGNPAGGTGQPGQVTNPDGTAAPNAPPAVDPSSPPPSNAPQQCSNMCYDVNTDTYKACDGNSGSCVSIPGSVARSSSGGCQSGLAFTACAGSPSAPKPGQPITDPATQIQSSDGFVQANPSTGANQSVGSVIYGLPGTSSNAGQKPGDVGPAPSSSSPNPGDKGNTASGGGDCNSPPAMSGDAALAMIARQQWLTRCGPDKTDKNNNGQPDWTEVSDSDGDKYNTADVNRDDVIKSETTDLGVLDTTSWAGNTCPDLGSAEVFGTQWSPDSELFCRWLSYMRAVVLLGAAVLCCFILSGGSKA